jgi:3'-phosphoadenosine 5'-phosphosulfate sulfotransferase (PAPS reductase)/FAD synthetase
VKQIVSVSTGKDSALTLAMAIEKYGSDVIVLFCDTGNEHPYIYEYLEYLEDFFSITINRLKADFHDRIINKRKFIANDVRIGRNNKGTKKKWTNKRKRVALLDSLQYSGNPMLDLCQWKGRFPSRRAQFCTQHLKTEQAEKFQNVIYEKNEVTIWTGVRRNESPARANVKGHEKVSDGFYFNRPLVDLTTEDVFKGLEYYGLKRNPLYDLGFSRVGCMPCVNANKGEVRLISELFPDIIDRIRSWESMVGSASRRGLSSFFHARTKGLKCHEAFEEANIDKYVEWSKTGLGGRQYDIPSMSKACIMAEGMCE